MKRKVIRNNDFSCLVDALTTRTDVRSSDDWSSRRRGLMIPNISCSLLRVCPPSPPPSPSPSPPPPSTLLWLYWNCCSCPETHRCQRCVDDKKSLIEHLQTKRWVVKPLGWALYEESPFSFYYFLLRIGPNVAGSSHHVATTFVLQ